MAKTRRSSLMSGAQRAGAIAAGIGTGAMLVPKVVEMVDKEGKLSPNIVNGVGIVGSLYLASKQKGGLVQDGLYGLAGGLTWNIVSGLMESSGLGWSNDYSSDFNFLAGAAANRANAGTI